MKEKIYAAPAVEPVTLAETKIHLRNDSQSLSDDIALNTSIAAGSHPVVTDYTLKGTGVSVIGKRAIIYLQPTNNGTGGTVDSKIQESDVDSDASYIDWKVSGVTQAFTQVTEANDTVNQEKEYTGGKAYIRVVAKTLVAACEFGASILVDAGNISEDTAISRMIATARKRIENDSRRKLITQTWDYFLEKFPDKDRIRIPYGNLQSVTSLKYKDSAGTETTLVADTDYYVDLNGDQCGEIVLCYGCSWPSDTLWPSKAITIRYVCGYGLAADVPDDAKSAILQYVSQLYANRGDDDGRGRNEKTIDPDITVKRLINLIPPLPWEFD